MSVHVDYDRRSFVAPNHTMTHVLNYALRSVLLGPGMCSAVLALLLCVCWCITLCFNIITYICHIVQY